MKYIFTTIVVALWYFVADYSVQNVPRFEIVIGILTLNFTMLILHVPLKMLDATKIKPLNRFAMVLMGFVYMCINANWAYRAFCLPQLLSDDQNIFHSMESVIAVVCGIITMLWVILMYEFILSAKRSRK